MTGDGSGSRVREIDVTGRETTPERRLAGWPMAAVNGGLLIERHGAGFLVDRNGESRLVFRGGFAAANRDKVAYVRCDNTPTDCPLQVLDLDTGEERTYSPPDGQHWAAEFGFDGLGISPDGARMAVYLEPREQAGAGDGPQSCCTAAVAVLELETGQITSTPIERSFEPNGVEAATWAPDSNMILFSTPGAIWTWRSGAAEAQQLPVSHSGWALAVVRSVPTSE